MKKHLLKASLLALSLSCFQGIAAGDLATGLTDGGSITANLAAIKSRLTATDQDLLTSMNSITTKLKLTTGGVTERNTVVKRLGDIRTTLVGGGTADLLSTVETALENINPSYTSLELLKDAVIDTVAIIGGTISITSATITDITAKIGGGEDSLDTLTTWVGTGSSTNYATVKSMVDDFNTAYTNIGGTADILTNIADLKTSLGTGENTLSDQIDTVTERVNAVSGAHMVANLAAFGEKITGASFPVDGTTDLTSTFIQNLTIGTRDPYTSVANMKAHLKHINEFTLDEAIGALGLTAGSYTSGTDSEKFTAATNDLEEIIGITNGINLAAITMTGDSITNLTDILDEFKVLLGGPGGGVTSVYARLKEICDEIGGTETTLSEKIEFLLSQTTPTPPAS